LPEPENRIGERSFREQMIRLTMKRRNCDRAEAETILDRIASRLEGHTHEEVRTMHPLPEQSP